jgi:hypothetical protein
VKEQSRQETNVKTSGKQSLLVSYGDMFLRNVGRLSTEYTAYIPEDRTVSTRWFFFDLC